MYSVWRVEFERPERWWRYYHCVAMASDGGDEFRLECAWERPIYYLEVTSASRDPADPLFLRVLFSDADCGKYVRQVLRIARHDVARRLARLDALHRDGAIGVTKMCREIGGKVAEPGDAADRGLIGGS